jgi:hypothetical protein
MRYLESTGANDVVALRGQFGRASIARGETPRAD